MIYVCCFLASSTFAFLATRAKSKFSMIIFSSLSIMVLCLLGGLRGIQIGTDTKGYGIMDFTDAQNSSSYTELLKRVPWREKGYLLICYMASKVLGHFNWALFLYQVITITCVYIAGYRHKKYISLPMFMMMFCLMYYNSTLNVIRQSIASAIVLMGVNELEEKRYLKFSLYVIVACLFHDSAVIAFPLIIGVHALMTSRIVLRNSWTKIFILLSMALGLVLIMPLARIFMRIFATSAKYYSFYIANIQSRADASSTNLTHMMVLVGALALITVYRRKAEKLIMPSEGGVDFYQFTLLFSIVYYLVIRLYAGRVLMYYDFLQTIVVCTLPKLVREKHLRFMVKAAVVGVVAFSWWYVYIRGGSSFTYPYVSVLG